MFVTVGEKSIYILFHFFPPQCKGCDLHLGLLLKSILEKDTGDRQIQYDTDIRILYDNTNDDFFSWWGM